MGQYLIFSLIEWACHNFLILILLVTFLSTLFFNKADWKPQVPKEVTPKVEKSPPQAKVKKSNLKPKPQKRNKNLQALKIQLCLRKFLLLPCRLRLTFLLMMMTTTFGTFMINLLTNQHERSIAIYCLLAYSRKKLLIGRLYCLVY